MPTLVPCPAPILRFCDNAGNPAVGGTVLTQVGGVNYPTYQDVNGNTALPNPIPLNSRGEIATAAGASAQCFLEPGVAYTFTLYDAAGNQLWQATYVAGAQVSLYGGVDTGAANAYVLDDIYNIPALTNGELIYFIPANTNTGASTINVNALGVTPIVNAGGGALFGGELVAGSPAEIMYYNGNWTLLNAAVAANSGSFQGTFTGFTAGNQVATVKYTVVGNQVILMFPAVNAASNATTFTMTGLPAALIPATAKQVSLTGAAMLDNSAPVEGASMGIGGGALIFCKSDNNGGANWTAAGNKGFAGSTEAVYSLL